ncbi:putative splicing factor 3 subunit [Trypanosoma theileri]|uniref:Putative splicing factor 3 subunit n=1 Tax=Trypanosoma theileri TaxID=67003 RepID=A0A1X0NNP0_9TRYP|nr:putative splicing factor 3 subunit [Trypanosoma theileri]ORC85760.1 putative splicing factor 3 subunit [Trypanosoma theileri]
MSTEDDTTPGIIAPGPELRAKIDKSAASLAKRDKRKAEEMMAKVLASPKREEFLYFEMTHVFYPFFLQRLNEYRAHPELIPTEEKKETPTGAGETTKTTTTGAAAAGATMASNTTTTIKAGGIVRREGGTTARHDPKRDEALRQAEIEAQRYLEDPFPNRYSLDLLQGTVDMPAMTLSYMTCTAQYIAKYGDRFLKDLLGRYRNNVAFRFLNSEDVRHEVLLKLVESYRLILHHDPEKVEDRLEQYQSPRNVVETICEEKVKYAKAAIARRKAALLTDEELRDKLEWNFFTVVHQFTLADLGLDGPMPQTAAAHRRTHLYNNDSNNNNDEVNARDGDDTTMDDNTSPTNEESKEAGTTEVSTSGGMIDPYSSGAPRMIRPPEGITGMPTFTPTFISSSLVTSTDPTAPPVRNKKNSYHDHRGGYNTSQGNTPGRYDVDNVTNSHGGSYMHSKDPTQIDDDLNNVAGSKHSRMENDGKGLSTDAEFERNSRQRRE